MTNTMTDSGFSYATRRGCAYCFKTLNPQDSDPALRDFQRCEQCAALYHATCRQSIQHCLRCDSSAFGSVQVAMPAPLPIIIRKPIRYEEKFEATRATQRRIAAAVAGLVTILIGVLGVVLYGAFLNLQQQAASAKATQQVIDAQQLAALATQQVEQTLTARSFTATYTATATKSIVPTRTIVPTAAPTIDNGSNSSISGGQFQQTLITTRPANHDDLTYYRNVWFYTNYVDLYRPGTKSYHIRVENRTLGFSMFWCGDTEARRDYIGDLLDIHFYIDGGQVSDSDVLVYDYIRQGVPCRRWGTLLSGWQSGSQVTLEIRYSIREDFTEDGNSFKAGSYKQILYATVS